MSAARLHLQLIRAFSIAVLTLLTCSATLSAQTVAWNANTEPDLAGYVVQYGTQSGNPSASIDVGNVTSRAMTGLTPGSTYYFRVVAYNVSGQQSVPSTEVSYTVPGTPTNPTVTAVSPSSGPTAGGTTITITGTNFVSGATVRVGGAAATNVVFVSATQLTARTPAGTAGTTTVQVTNPNGQSASAAFTYTASSGPTITSVSPSSGPTAGGTTITITGTGFVLGSGGEIRVGGVMTTNIAYISSTQLQARTPAGSAGARDVYVRNPNGATVTLSGGFTYTSATAPTLTAVSPTSGPTAGGTTITLTGTGFVSGATVRVGGVAATNVAFVSATQVTARTPAGTAGARDVQITNPNGQSATRTGGFTYTAPSGVTITSVTPSSGPASGGTTITIYGTNFVLGSGGEIRVGGVMCSNIQYISSTQLRARTPAGTVGARDVYVRNPTGQTVTLAGGFTYTSGTTSAQTTLTQNDGTYRLYLAEGVESEQMSTQLAIANPQETDAQATLTFQTSTGEQTQLAVDVPARSRRTVDAASVPELAGATFSTTLESNQELALDRLISLNADGAAASLETAVDQPATSWYFAEGSTVDPQELFYLVQNPGTAAATVRVRYLLPNGQAPVERTYSVAAGSRATIWVDREDPALATTDVAAEITSVDGAPIVVERSLYLREAGSAAPRGGDSGTGVTAPATRWFVEGATGPYAMRLLLANPGAEAAQVQVAFRRADGRTVNRSYSVAASSRHTVDVAAVHPSLTDTELGITVQASAPIVVERTKWWGANGRLDESVSGAGSTAGGARWLLAEGQQGGDRQAATSVVVFNQGAATNVKVTLLFEDGPEASATFPVAAGARFAVPMADAFPTAEGRRFSVLVEGAEATANLVVDRAIFWQSAGATRTAGADGAASRLR